MTSWAPQEWIASRIMPVDGRLPGPPTTTVAPASSKSFSSPGPAATATTWRPARVVVRRARAPSGDLLGEVGDPDPVRAPGRDAGLDRRADVVDVHVDVPEAVAADHDERVAQAGQRLP